MSALFVFEERAKRGGGDRKAKCVWGREREEFIAPGWDERLNSKVMQSSRYTQYTVQRREWMKRRRRRKKKSRLCCNMKVF